MSRTDKSYRRNFHAVVSDIIPDAVIEKRNRKKAWKYGYNEEYDVVVISKNGTIGQILEINGLIIALPEQPGKIRNENLAAEDQKWHRYKVPTELVHFDKLYKDEANPEAKLQQVYMKHKIFIDADFDRKFNGDWFLNDGEPIYISGYYYFFLQHYKLTDMRRYGDFRMPQRDYFLFIEACFADERCLGSLLLKSRRSAFSTSTGSIMLCKSITFKDGFFPIVSKKDDDAKTVFTKHVVKPLVELPKHLQPQRTGEVIPKKELIYSSAKKKLTTNNKADNSDEGLDTLITFYATTLDAYDGNQVTISCNDEIGKLKGNLDINEYWDQAHKLCHIVGSEIVGKALCGSTANPPNKGGKNYAKFYKDSQLSTRTETGQTETGLYAIFIPADFTTMGFFDQWGYVIYEDPVQPVMNELGKMKKIGVKTYLDKQQRACGDNVKKLNAQKRNNPRNDNDPFLDEDASNMYATTGMINLKNFLQEYSKTPEYKTLVYRFDLVWDKGVVDGTVKMIPNSNGRFMAYAPSGVLPVPKEYRNKFEMKGTRKSPVNGHLGAFGVDPYQANRTQYGTGSKQGFVGMATDHTDLSDQHKRSTFLFYNYRTNTVEEAIEDVIKACVYFSMPALIEVNKDTLVRTMYKRGYRNYVMNNPLKTKAELTPDEATFGGIYTSVANVDKQEQGLETYINENFPEEINKDNIKSPFTELNESTEAYTRENRKTKDSTVAWQLAFLATNKKVKKREPVSTLNSSEESIVSLFAYTDDDFEKEIKYTRHE
ncbi:hypothetical protein [uncultured Chryseobacterium sp.]|uniref:hypothetical protein n=1 Tax=uncultured Chryseobacterium sp. TaxID=259322 RepID=UPI0025D7E190|nr:hypothetical protein [uncultured Chryseobacterium sp.]